MMSLNGSSFGDQAMTKTFLNDRTCMVRLSMAKQMTIQTTNFLLPLRLPRRRWEDNIKMDVEEVGGGRGDRMELAQDRDRWRALVSTVKNLRVP
jgi:hypothetical protein